MSPHSRFAAAWRRYPVRRQLEEADCGPACLEMIAAWHGVRHPPELLRELAHVQAGGTSMLDLLTVAQRLGWRARGVNVEEPGELEDEEGRALLPAVAHWNEDHFVVLYEVNAREAVVGDPAAGLRRVPRERLGEHWSGVLLLLEPTEAVWRPARPEEGGSRPSALRRFAWGLLRYRTLLAQALLATVLLQGLALAQPFLLQRLVDRVVGGREVPLLGTIGVALAVVLVSQAVATVARGAALFWLSGRYSALLLARFWARLLTLPLSFFARRHRGDLLRRLGDHQRIRRVLQGTSASVLLDGVMLVGYGALLLRYGAGIFAIFLASTAAYVGWTLWVLPRRTELDSERFRVGAESSRLEMQMLSGIQTLKACGAERQMRTAWERLQAQELEASHRLWRLDTLHQVGTLFVGQAMFAGILLYEAWLVLTGALTLGQMVATTAVLGLVLAPLQNLVTFVRDIQEVGLSLRRVEVVHEAEPEPLGDGERAPPALERAPEIRLEHVTFRYGSPHEPPTLEDVSFTLPAGKMTAIVGRSGAGKSTLAHLLSGLYRPQEGRILYDGRPLEELPLAGLRRSLAYVFQKTDVFDGTLAENIALGEPEPERERVLHAARTACLDDLLGLPRGLDTRIGEAGVRLSGGEEQRLQLARALYRDPRVLLLDEATSHLDASTERAITGSLQREAAGRTMVVVAHRLSTVRRADHIVVLERGRVVEQGTHAQLLALEGGHYRRLVEDQLEG